MADFKEAKVATVKMRADLKADGTLAKTGDAVAGYKNISINGMKANCTLDEAKTVFDTFYGTIGEMQYDTLTAEKNISVGVNR